MAPEPTIGGLTADQLVDEVVEQALNNLITREYEREVFRQAATAGATAMYSRLVGLGKDLLDPPPGQIRPERVGATTAGCTCPDIEVLALSPYTDDIIKGLAPGCPIHGRG